MKRPGTLLNKIERTLEKVFYYDIIESRKKEYYIGEPIAFYCGYLFDRKAYLKSALLFLTAFILPPFDLHKRAAVGELCRFSFGSRVKSRVN